MRVFDFDNYKEFVVKLLKSMPKGGHGQYRRIALHLKVNSVVVSQIFNGSRDLSSEQALALSEYLGLSALERDYLLVLVQLDRAGTAELRKLLKEKLIELREKSKDLKTRLQQDKHMTEEAKAIFYSNWYYSGARLAASIPGLHTVDAVAESLRLPRATIKVVFEFLLNQGLCVEKSGKITMGPNRTHLESSSPFISRNQVNWRLKAIEKMTPQNSEDLFYSGPMSVSQSGATQIRKEIIELIERVTKTVVDDPKNPERLACLNIDWFGI